MSCEHGDWKPITGYWGRYLCRRCGVLAYRAFVTGVTRSQTMCIYVCHVKGCGRGAVVRRPEQRCAVHRER